MNVELLLVPYDTALRGWRMGAGPEHLLQAGLISRLEALGHAVSSSVIMTVRDAPAEIGTAFELMRLVAQRVRAAREQGRFPLVLSGNCNTAPGTLAGLTPASRAVFWFDAHADCNTPDTTSSGFLDGTALATAMGWCWRQMTSSIPGFQPVSDHSVVLLGARDVDPLEAELMSRSAVRVLAPGSLRDGGLARQIASIRPQVDLAYVHCDLDALDPAEGRANPFAVAGGLTVAEIESAVREIGRSVPLKAAAVTAYAPEYDADGRIAEAALRIIESLLAAAARS
ncbi:MAG TPA: arginase family protein [Thermoanaerobaculia bacterium]|nr:arginase family protein [Thermoanaerobaculia bacterium]